MEAYRDPLRRGITRRTINEIITVPGLSVDIGKMMRSVMKNPVDRSLSVYSSQNPDLLNEYDLKMMSRLDRLRTHAQLRDSNRFKQKEVQNSIVKAEKVMARKKADNERKQKENQK